MVFYSNLWRFGHILCRFCVFSLIWIVIGGAFLPIFLGVTFYAYGYCFVAHWMASRSDGGNFEHDTVLFVMVLGSVATPLYAKSFWTLAPKWIDNGIMILFVTLMANNGWNCGICAEEEPRQMDNNEVIDMD